MNGALPRARRRYQIAKAKPITALQLFLVDSWRVLNLTLANHAAKASAHALSFFQAVSGRRRRDGPASKLRT